MKSDYGILTWLNDKDGREYVCYAKESNDNKKVEELSENEKSHVRM